MLLHIWSQCLFRLLAFRTTLHFSSRCSLPPFRHRHELSDELHTAISSGELAHLPDLRKLLTQGEVLSAAVLGPPKPRAEAAAGSSRGRHALPPVPVSLRLSLVQGAALAGGAPMPKGCLVWGVVESIQE
jgi:hypothetical protein